MNNSADYQMKTRRSPACEFRSRGREKLRGNWKLAILAFFLASVLCAGVNVAAIDGIFQASIDLSLGDLIEDANLYPLNRVSPEEFFAGLADKELVDILYGPGTTGDPATLLAILIIAILSAFGTGLLVSVFVGAPVTLGYHKLHLQMADDETPTINLLFSYFPTTYWKSVLLRLLHSVIVAAIPLLATVLSAVAAYYFFLPYWALAWEAETMTGFLSVLLTPLPKVLLVTGAISLVGIVANFFIVYRYVFCYMIMAEYPSMGVIDALRNSARLMRGNKWRLFCLQISFIGWGILCGLTLGIGVFWLIPYMNAASTEFYDEIANRSAAREVEFPSLDPEDYYS